MSSSESWRLLAGWSPTLLLLGGVVVVGYSALFGVEAIANTTIEKSVVAGIGYTTVFVGLLGLYPSLADGSPRLAMAGAGCAVLGGLGFAGVFLIHAGQLLSVIPTPGPDWLAIVNLPAIIGMIPGFLAFGTASLRTDAHPPGVGWLLLAPGVIFTLNFVGVALIGAESLTPWWGFLITLGEAIAILGVGIKLRRDAREPSRPEPTADAHT